MTTVVRPQRRKRYSAIYAADLMVMTHAQVFATMVSTAGAGPYPRGHRERFRPLPEKNAPVHLGDVIPPYFC